VLPGPIALGDTIDRASLRLDGHSMKGYTGLTLADGDLDADGDADLIVSEYGFSEVYVVHMPLAGEWNVLAVDHLRLDFGAWGGHAGADLDVVDYDGDGIDDLLVGAPRSSPGGLVVAGVAEVFSGAGAVRLFSFAGTQTFDRFGTSVAGIGDLSGDGVPDLLVGRPLVGAGVAYLYSGSGGTLLQSIPPTIAGPELLMDPPLAFTLLTVVKSRAVSYSHRTSPSRVE
jgi:hypothetical protein